MHTPALWLAVAVTGGAGASPQLVYPNTLVSSARFGDRLAVSGDTLAVGAYRDVLPPATGSGAVYLYVGGGAGLLEQARLENPSNEVCSRFGSSVALDADTLLVGAPDTCSFEVALAHVYTRTAGVWTLEAPLGHPLPASLDGFGEAVALAGDVAFVGAPRGSSGGDVLVFTRSGSTWSAGAVLPPPGGSVLGFGASLHLEGDTLLVGEDHVSQFSPQAPGAVHVYTGSGSTWSHQAVLSAPMGFAGDRFGESLAGSDDQWVIGAPGWSSGGPGAGAVFVFEGQGSALGLAQTLEPQAPGAGFDAFGASVALTSDLLAIGAPGAAPLGSIATGAVSVFRTQGGSWVESELLADDAGELNDVLGTAVAVRGQAVYAGGPGIDLGPQLSPPLDSIELAEYLDDLDQLWVIDDEHRVVVQQPLLASYLLGTIQWIPSGTSSDGDRPLKGSAYDPVQGRLYVVNNLDELWRIDPATLDATPIGFVNFDQVRGLAFDPGTGTLYGHEDAMNRLIAIDPANALATAIGGAGNLKWKGLDWNASTGKLYASADSGELFTLNTSNGNATHLGTTNRTFPSLTSGPNGELLGTGGTGLVGSVWEIELPSLQLLTVPVLLFSGGAVVAFDAGEPQAYCTAGTSASGCVASISAVGSASASAPSGFDLVVSDVEGAKRGLFFYGTSGRQAAPWGNGTSYQCVVPPVRRTTLLGESGTGGACDGGQVFDLNAWFQAKPGANPGAGVLVQAQYWYRDPFVGSNVKTSLSDGVEFLVGG